MSASSYNQNERQWLQLFERTLRDILQAINPLREDWNVRFHVRDEIRAVVESVESLRGATVEPYGSFVSNLFTKWGDLDISIELQNGSYISSAGRKHKQSVLAEVLQALRKRGGFRRLLFISNARVPILKLEGRYNISCDISINNLSGQMKSKMLFWINGIDGRFRDLVLLVKVWANNHRINDSKSGTLNSYCLSLLVVFHFQTLEPAILPPLREIYPGNMIDDLTGVRAAAEKHIEDICGANILRIKADKSRIINRSSLSELFISFLAKFSDICSGASTQGVSPFAGQMEDIDSVMRWLPKTYALFLEDPFEQPANTARTVSSNQLMKIAEAIRVTQETLVPENQNPASLASVMIGQHQPPLFGANKPVSRNGFNPHPARRYPPSKTPQAQPRFPKKPMDKHQNGESNGAMNASTSQKKPMDKHQNGESNGAMNASTSLKKPMDKHQNGESNGAMNASTSQKKPMDKHQNQNGESNGAMNASTSQKPQVWRPRK